MSPKMPEPAWLLHGPDNGAVYMDCPDCEGEGKRKGWRALAPLQPEVDWDCRRCDGTGKVEIPADEIDTEETEPDDDRR